MVLNCDFKNTIQNHEFKVIPKLKNNLLHYTFKIRKKTRLLLPSVFLKINMSSRDAYFSKITELFFTLNLVLKSIQQPSDTTLDVFFYISEYNIY